MGTQHVRWWGTGGTLEATLLDPRLIEDYINQLVVVVVVAVGAIDYYLETGNFVN